MLVRGKPSRTEPLGQTVRDRGLIEEHQLLFSASACGGGEALLAGQTACGDGSWALGPRYPATIVKLALRPGRRMGVVGSAAVTLSW